MLVNRGRLRAAMRRCGFDGYGTEIAAIASAAGVEETTVTRLYLSGGQAPENAVYEIARVLGCKVTDLT